MIKLVALKLYRFCRAKFQSFKLFTRRYNFRHVIAPAHHIFYVSPKDIQLLTNCEDKREQEIRNRNFSMEENRGKVVGGDWDDSSYIFEELAVYKAINERISLEKKWEDTEFYTECMRDIDSGRVLWKCSTSSELLERFDFIDKIIIDMKRNGYKSGYDSHILGEDATMLAKSRKYSDEITINIGRNGEFYFQDGRHRLAIAKVLGISKVPVKILVRHEGWVSKLLRIKNQESLKSFCQHPDVSMLLELNKTL